MKNPTSLRVPPVDSAENLNIRDVDGNKEDAAVIVVGTTESQMAYIKGILSVILTLTTEDYDMTIYVPAVVDVDNTMMPQVTFYDKKLKAAVASGDIVAGTFKLARYRANSRTEILGATAWTVTTGKIKDSRQAASASWATDDLAVWEPQGDTTIEVNGVVVTPMIPELMIPIGDISTLETKVDTVDSNVDLIKIETDKIPAEVIKTTAIKTVTDVLPDAGAFTTEFVKTAAIKTATDKVAGEVIKTTAIQAETDKIAATITKINTIEEAIIPGNHTEKVYPFDTSGITVTPGNTVFGLTTILIPIDGIIENYGWGSAGSTTSYNLVGFLLMLDAGVSNPNTIQFLRVVKATATLLGTNCTAGDTALLMADTSDFLAGDIVWVTDTGTPAGELCYVDTITANTSLNTSVLAVADIPATIVTSFTTGADATVYLVRRAGDTDYRAMWDKFAHANTKSIIRHELHGARDMAIGDGLICRALGIDGAAGVMLITAIYH